MLAQKMCFMHCIRGTMANVNGEPSSREYRDCRPGGDWPGAIVAASRILRNARRPVRHTRRSYRLDAAGPRDRASLGVPAPPSGYLLHQPAEQREPDCGDSQSDYRAAAGSRFP